MTAPRHARILDLSGFAFTGKAAVIDLMREIRGCAVPSHEFEFALIRCPGGLLDLEHALVDDWSPIRSCEAIRRFRRLIDVYGGDGGFRARATRRGHHYDRMFPGFTRRSESFVDSLVLQTWKGEWPFATYGESVAEVVVRKILFKLGKREAAMYPIYLTAPDRAAFEAAVRAYLSDVFAAGRGPDVDVVVIHNAFEPFDPVSSMRFFDDARAIVVDRDPRDVYVAAQRYVGTDGRRGWPSLTTDGVEGFIAQYRTLRSKVKRERDDDRVLRIGFESLVRDYERVLDAILNLVGKTRADHVRARQHFDPERSAGGIGAWRGFEDQRAIAMIQEQLPEFCVAL